MVTLIFANMQFYYTTIVLLPIELFMIAYIIFMGWNMVNDPIIGHFCDKSTRWTLKYGKRFPYIVIGIIGLAISLILVFSMPIADPSQNPLPVFIWLLVVVCLYDTCYALYMVNAASLFQYKVRDDSDRRKSGGLLLLTGSLGMIIATILQPIIVESIGRETILAWAIQAIVFAGIIFATLLLMGKGIRESEELRSYRDIMDSKEHISFFKALKTILRLRSYDAYIISSLSYQITTAIAMASLSFVIVYAFGLDLTASILPLIILTTVAPLTAPIWIKLGNKYGSKKIYTLSFLIIIVSFIPMLWIVDYIWVLVVFIFIGAGFGCNGVMQHPIDADVIEEAAIKTGTRNEGVYNGIQTFFMRLSIGAQVLVIGSIQLLTGFDPGASTQTELAILGLRLTVSIAPIIVLTIGICLFWILYDITPEKRAQMRKKLIELNL
ncbi:MAG: MFS transporter [Promethearchaeota archaeon]